jgi:hypothetical protein
MAQVIVIKGIKNMTFNEKRESDEAMKPGSSEAASSFTYELAIFRTFYEFRDEQFK